MSTQTFQGRRPAARSGLRRHTVHHDANLSAIRHMRSLIGDCFAQRAIVYWIDLLVTVTIGYGFAIVYLSTPALSWLKFVALIISGVALFRAGSFIHEIAHMRAGQMRGFRVAWNLICGVPMIMPSFLYDSHIDHHQVRHYGTRRDGEYLPLGAGPLYQIVLYLMEVLVIPILAVVRFAVLGPVSFFNPRLRQWVLERASTYVSNPWYRREIPAGAPRGWWAAVDLFTTLRVWCMLGIVAVGVVPWTRLAELYVLAVFIIGLNWIRNLAAHRYRNTGDEMSYMDQLADSINITGRPLVTELLFPLGLRFHALHHLFPGIPYHSLSKAHRRLMALLPSDAPYRRTVYPSFLSVMRQLVRDARASTLEAREPAAV